MALRGVFEIKAPIMRALFEIDVAGDPERERDILLSSTRGSAARAGQVRKTNLYIIISTSKGGGFQPEPEARVGRKNLGASSHRGWRHHLS